MSTRALPTSRDMVSILGENFFYEEVRCDYLVTEKMKKVWAVLIDLYLEFVRICEKYNLQYFAYAGTVLGAVRHQGFIPWDDDMDVCMLRLDYEKFLEIAPSELSEPYKLQTPFTEPGYFRTITRLSNTHTTRIAQFFHHSGMSHGMMLDIFPIDKCNPETHESEMDIIRLAAKRCSQYMKRNDTDIMTPEHYASWKEYMPDDPMKEWKTVQSIAAKWQNSDLDYLSMKTLASPRGSVYNKPMDKKWFSTSKVAKFEGIEVKIPIGYNDFLTDKFGNYMQFPPIDQRSSGHYGLIIDPEKPYTEYL